MILWRDEFERDARHLETGLSRLGREAEFRHFGRGRNLLAEFVGRRTFGRGLAGIVARPAERGRRRLAGKPWQWRDRADRDSLSLTG